MPKETKPTQSVDAGTLFADAVKEQLNGGKHQTWNSADSEAVIQKLMVDAEGKPIELDEEAKRLIRALVNPTMETQTAVIDDLAKRNSCSLGGDHLAYIGRVINPQSFRQQLKKAEFLPRSQEQRPTLKKLLSKA